MSVISIKQYLSTWFTPGNDHHPDFGSKAWEPIFSKDRNLKENLPYIDMLKQNTKSGDSFNIFWRGTEDPRHFYAIEEVEEFCRGTHLDNLESTMVTRKIQRRAWLDDRSFPQGVSSGCVRKYQNPLTAAELRNHLKVPVWNKL
jgi:hypothetical protein